MNRRGTALRVALFAVLVVGLLGGVWGQTSAAADDADAPTVGVAEERRATAERLSGLAGGTLGLAGSGVALGLGIGLGLGGVGAYGYWTRRFGS